MDESKNDPGPKKARFGKNETVTIEGMIMRVTGFGNKTINLKLKNRGEAYKLKEAKFKKGKLIKVKGLTFKVRGADTKRGKLFLKKGKEE